MKETTISDARMFLLVRHILKWETGVESTGKEMLADYFAECKKHGFTDDPDDSGGATMCGVTLATFKAHFGKGKTVADLKAITAQQWTDILYQDYWQRWRADEIESVSVACMLVDWLWHSGSFGIRIPQYMLGVTVDGVVGPKTIAAVNGKDAKTLFEDLREERKNFLTRIATGAKKKYLKGWLNRVNDLEFYA